MGCIRRLLTLGMVEGLGLLLMLLRLTLLPAAGEGVAAPAQEHTA